jgi:hypothetical protein
VHVKRGGTCMHAICHECYIKGLNSSSSGRRRGARPSRFSS